MRELDPVLDHLCLQLLWSEGSSETCCVIKVDFQFLGQWVEQKKLEKIHSQVTHGGVFVGNCRILLSSIMTVWALNMIYLKIQNQFYGNLMLHWTESGAQMAC